MYKAYTAADYRKHLNFTDDYSVDGFIVYGTYAKFPYDQLENSLKNLGIKYEISRPVHDFMNHITEIKIADKLFWFTTAYGGAELSEDLHLACLFGSQKNILLGSCGGLKHGASSRDLIIPDWSYADESSAKAYQPDANSMYQSDGELSDKIANKLSLKYKVHHGPTITYQAMLAETQEDIKNWSDQGYLGVEMEASTVFAVSKHFNVPAVAILMIGDNLIEEETCLDINYENTRDKRRQVSQDIFDVAVNELVGD
jgi:purine-nucleoside phosphorylase